MDSGSSPRRLVDYFVEVIAEPAGASLCLRVRMRTALRCWTSD